MACLKLAVWALLLGDAIVAAEVTVLSKVQTLYDRSPKLRVKLTGLIGDEHDINIVIGAKGQTLKADKDFLITKDDDGLILKLLTNRRWVDLSERPPPLSLLLSSVKFKDGKEQLFEPVVLANVLETPSIEENDLVLYSTASNELRIKGTGFIGAKDIDLFFEPPLLKEIAYEIVSKFPCSKNEIVIRLRHGYEWRKTAGPLYIKGVDTGGGPAKQGLEDGVQVAVVSMDLPEHQVTVDSTFLEQVIYHDQPSVFVTGSGFNPLGNNLRFANGILGKGVNYTISKTTETAMTLTLTPGSVWRANVDNLPAFLTLLAVNAGEGFVAVGPKNSAKGRDIATVFERPNVVSGNAKLYQSASHELHIYGAGFTSTLSTPKIKFNVALEEGKDYSIRVVERDDLEITLKDKKSWGAIGPLIVTSINTRGGDESGWISFAGSGVHVAEIVADIDAGTTAGVEIHPMGTKVYQSVLQKTIELTGDGFVEGMEIVFDPAIRAGTDYTLSVKSKNKAVLNLLPGKSWRQQEGLLLAMEIKTQGSSYPLAGGAGIRVAVVLLDPVLEAGSETFHETQSKVIGINGKGFTSVGETKIKVTPTDPNAFKILGVLEDTVRLQLIQDFDWLPSYMLKPEDDKKIPLEVLSIDTGAGEVRFATPIVVGYIVADIPGVVCDDSCEFAFDGVCDDGTESEYAEYYEKNGEYGDDWQENEYMDDDEKDADKGGEEEGEDDDAAEDDYYMEDDGYKVSACVEGTDCTDCGGVQEPFVPGQPLPAGAEACVNTCVYARDGQCDDPRGEDYCEMGTDCQDCGPVGADNFTRTDDDAWWDDDDDYWNNDDEEFLSQTGGLEANRHKVRTLKRDGGMSGAAWFLFFLEATVYTIGGIFAVIGLYGLWRWYNGQSIPLLAAFNSAFNPDLSGGDGEGTSARRMAITPDVIRT